MMDSTATRRRLLSRAVHGIAAALVLAMAGGFGMSPASAEEGRAIPAPALDTPARPAAESETAVFAGGCFWGVQGVFQHINGVTSAVSGYAGGDKATAKYDVVSSGKTSHAEAVQVTFDPRKVSYAKLLQVYFSVAHDPTELNRQGPDFGTQYRSTVFPTTDDQARSAAAYIAQLDQAHAFGKALATTIEPRRDFFAAEDYHQDFLTRHPRHPYIVINDMPKIENLKRLFPDLYRAEPVLVMAARSN